MKKIVLICSLIGLLVGCQYNDVCNEDVPDTPKLVIKFYDHEFPDNLKEVPNFNVISPDADSFYFENPINDTIAKIPLKSNASSTTYQFIIHQGDEDNSELIDTITFEYTTDITFIDRACGFKTEFYDLNINESTLTNNWIKDVEIPEPKNITDEKDAHLYIYF